ncbi:MAG: hypothetical protein ACOY32_15885 [Thermodesulfobacteriota bacterium]
MGFIKKMFNQAAMPVFRKAAGNKGFFKKVAIVVIALSALFFVGIAGLLIAMLVWITSLFTTRPDPELIAMQQLIASGEIVLTMEQKEKISPIVEQLAAKEVPEEQQNALMEELWAVFSPEQMKKIRAKQNELASKAEGVSALPAQVVVYLEKYTGLTIEKVREHIDAVLAWWKMRKPGNSAEELHETLQRI